MPGWSFTGTIFDWATTKRGVVIVDHSDTCNDLGKIGACWFYDYNERPRVCPNTEAVPMGPCWSPSAPGNDSEYLLGLNEPNRTGHCGYRTPRDCAIECRNVEKDWGAKYKLVSPAPAHLGNATPRLDGIDYLSAVRDEYLALHKSDKGSYPSPCPQWDVLACHTYDALPNAIARVRAFVQAAQDWAIPGGVWVTEFSNACFAGTEAQKLKDLRDFLSYLNGERMVMRYSWFGNRARGGYPPLIDSRGNLTARGRIYAA